MLRQLAFLTLLPSLASATPLVANTGEEVSDLAAYCKSLDEATTCAITDEEKIADLAKPAGPYLAARVFWAGASITVPDNACYLGIRTGQRWTVTSLHSDCWGNGKYYRRLAVTELVVHTVGRASPELWVRYTVESSERDDDASATEELLVICGMTDGNPRCTAPIVLGLETNGKQRWKVKATRSKAGALTLALQKGKRADLPAETAALLGKRTLVVE